MSPAPDRASARRSVSLTMPCAKAPPEKACCITVKPISITIEHEAADERRLNEVGGELADDGEAARHDPGDEEEPGRDQHHGPVVAVGGEVHDEHEAMPATAAIETRATPAATGGLMTARPTRAARKTSQKKATWP